MARTAAVGEVVFKGRPAEPVKAKCSLTAQYLR